jgi:hypothetical protein
MARLEFLPSLAGNWGREQDDFAGNGTCKGPTVPPGLSGAVMALSHGPSFSLSGLIKDNNVSKVENLNEYHLLAWLC